MYPVAGTVFWRIWPAVLFHTLFSAIVVGVTKFTRYNLGVPSSMLTVLGLVVGFGISYRASQGYSNFQEGRQRWADVIRISRTMARLCWVHVPESLDGKVESVSEKDKKIAREEKKKFIGLIEAFSVASKHALRGEKGGVLFEDLYPLVSWLPRFHQDILPSTDNDHAFSTALNGASHTSKSYGSTKKRSQPTLHVDAAGTLPPHPLPSSSNSDTHVQNGETQPLLRPAEDTSTHSSRSILWDYFLPFWIFSSLFRRPTSSSGSTLHRTKTIHRPRRSVTGIAQGGAHVLGGVRKFSPEVLHTEDEDNLPLIILGEMSGYLAVLERRGGTSGPVIGGLFTGIQGLEDALTGMEKIVTTPLPVCYAVHLRQTVWIYLLALPSQLVGPAGYFTIPTLLVASFLFLGFLGAGEELSLPFGWDENDINIDLLITSVIKNDLRDVMHLTPASTLVDAASDRGQWYVAATEQDEDKVVGSNEGSIAPPRFEDVDVRIEMGR